MVKLPFIGKQLDFNESIKKFTVLVTITSLLSGLVIIYQNNSNRVNYIFHGQHTNTMMDEEIKDQSFHVYLVNESIDGKSLSDFTGYFSTDLNLRGNWFVGLKEISLTNNTYLLAANCIQIVYYLKQLLF